MMIRALYISVIAVLLPVVVFALGDQPQEKLVVGAPAPDFTLPYATKNEIVREGITLSDMIGKSNIVLAFYPANWSGGCTAQLCSYRDNFSALQDLDATILAISGDYVFSHHAWAMQENFQFMLLSDHFHEVGRLYDSYDEERGFNKRTVYVVDREGRIAYINPNYSVAGGDDFRSLQAALQELQE
jgi:peroxiredoxin